MTTPKTYAMTPDQRAIVEAADGPWIVLAGAGTGKTRVIVERVRWLLEQHGQVRARVERADGTTRVDYIPAEPAPRHGNPFEGPLVPEQLLVLTYNTKAAEELQQRLDETAGVGPAVRARMTVKNFHGFCHQVLGDSGPEAELPGMPDVLDGPGQVLLLRDLRPDMDLLYHNDFSMGIFAGFINRSKDELIWPEDFDRFVAEERRIFEDQYGSFEAAVDRLRAAGNLQPVRKVADEHRKVRTGLRLEALGMPANAYDPKSPAKIADREARRTASGDGEATAMKRLSPEQQARAVELAATYERDGAALEVLRQHELAAVYHLYQQELAKRGALDYAEQIALVIRLFKTRPNLLRRWQRQYRYILVDEFQDANAAQIELITLLGRTPDRPDNVMVVGDDDQSIYRFRGAVVDAFGDFATRFAEPPAHDPERAPAAGPGRLTITENYRSLGNVLHGANALITRNLSRVDPDKRLRTGQDLGHPIELLVCNGAEDEAVAIVDRIRELAGPRTAGENGATETREAAWGSVAVLYRKHKHRDLIVNRLHDEGIPYTVVGGLSLFDEPEIRDAEAGLRAIADPLDDASLVRMMTAGPWRLDAVEILRVTRDAAFDRAHIIDAVRRIVAGGVVRESPMDAEAVAAAESGKANLRNAGIADETRAKLRRLLDVLERQAPRTRRDGPFSVLTAYVEESGAILDLLAAGSLEAKRRVVHLGSLLRFASDWQAARPEGSLADFLAYLDAYKNADGELPTSVELAEDAEGVRLMTLYQAKGGQFPIVFVPQLLDGEWPTKDRGQGWFPVELLRGARPTGDTHTEEERRLLYVAMTRAQERLVLTTFGAGEAKKASPFVDELREGDPDHLLVVDRTGEGAGGDPAELTEADPDEGAVEADAEEPGGASDTGQVMPTARRTMPIPRAQERRLELRLRAAELVSLMEAAAPDAPETPAALDGLAARLADVGRSAALAADAARAAGLDPITLRSVVLDSGEGANLLRVAPLPGKLSYTALKTYEDCPAKFAFSYVYRIPPPDTVAAPLTFGTTVHAAFEEFTKLRRDRLARGEEPPTREDLDRIFAERWKPSDFGTTTTEETFKRRVPTLLDTFWRNELASTAEAEHEELDFTLVIDPGDGSAPIRIGGSIDRIDRLASGGIEVVDYKTGKVSSQKDVSENLQLVIYALACRDTLGLGNPEKVTLYFTESDQRMSTSRTDEQLDAERAKIVQLVADIRTGNFAANPKADCRYCDFKPICVERRDTAW